jgi:hypothetical protein
MRLAANHYAGLVCALILAFVVAWQALGLPVPPPPGGRRRPGPSWPVGSGGWAPRGPSEPFYDAAVDAADVRGTRSSDYAAAGLAAFYSDPTNRPPLATDLLMDPTENDVICNLGAPALAAAVCVKPTTVNAVSCNDTTLLVRPPYDCSATDPNVVRVPGDPADCSVRVLQGSYRLTKVCVTVPASLLPQGTSNLITLQLAASAYGTRMFVLSRPIWLALPGSSLYAVQRDGAVGATNTLTNYDSAGADPVTVAAAPAAAAVWDPTRDGGLTAAGAVAKLLGPQAPSSTPWWAQVGGAGATVAGVIDTWMPLTMYYMNFAQPVASMAQADAFTLYFQVGETSQLSATAPTTLFSVGQVQVQATQSTVAVTSAGALAWNTSALLPNCALVVTYTTNLQFVACISRARVLFRSFGKQAPVTDPLPTIQASFAAAVAATGAGTGGGGGLAGAWQAFSPPAPHTFACIPNLAALASSLNLL